MSQRIAKFDAGGEPVGRMLNGLPGVGNGILTEIAGFNIQHIVTALSQDHKPAGSIKSRFAARIMNREKPLNENAK
jgi:hypothetical protein